MGDDCEPEREPQQDRAGCARRRRWRGVRDLRFAQWRKKPSFVYIWSPELPQLGAFQVSFLALSRLEWLRFCFQSRGLALILLFAFFGYLMFRILCGLENCVGNVYTFWNYIARNALNTMSFGLELCVFAENLVIILVSYCIIGHLRVAGKLKLPP